MPDSPFLSKLNGDFIPGDEDVPIIKELILQQSSKLSELALKVAEAKQRYDDLLDQQSHLEKLIQGHRQLISPPRRNIVPVDIWREIFYHCLPDNHDAIMHPREAPSLLTQVCSTWRQITLSTPRLWSSIHIPIVDNLPLLPRDTNIEHSDEGALWRVRSERRAKCITEWLTRSSSAPLSITLGDSSYIPYPDMAYETTQAHILLNSILPFSTQWNKLRIVVTKQRLQDLSDLKASQMHSLETLDVENVITWEDPDEPPLIPKYAHRNLPLFLAPNLRRVSISQMMDDVASFPLPWHQLTHLSLSHNDYPKLSFEIVNLLKACPKMVEFRILTIVDPGPRSDANTLTTLPHDHHGQITLPNLKVFEISGEGSSSDPKMFDSIATPALELVSFFLPSQAGGSPLLPLARQTNLTSLNTNSVLFVNDDFLLILRSCLSLKHLYISCTPNYYPESLPPIDRTDSFLKMLSIPDNNDNILCPLLEEIHITTGVTDFTDFGVLDFIKAKQAGPVGASGLAKLKCLKISFPRYQNEPMAADLQPYIDDGLDLVLCYMERFTELDGDAYRNIPFPSSGLLHHFELSPNVKLF